MSQNSCFCRPVGHVGVYRREVHLDSKNKRKQRSCKFLLPSIERVTEKQNTYNTYLQNTLSLVTSRPLRCSNKSCSDLLSCLFLVNISCSGRHLAASPRETSLLFVSGCCSGALSAAAAPLALLWWWPSHDPEGVQNVSTNCRLVWRTKDNEERAGNTVSLNLLISFSTFLPPTAIVTQTQRLRFYFLFWYFDRFSVTKWCFTSNQFILISYLATVLLKDSNICLHVEAWQLWN